MKEIVQVNDEYQKGAYLERQMKQLLVSIEKEPLPREVRELAAELQKLLDDAHAAKKKKS